MLILRKIVVIKIEYILLRRRHFFCIFDTVANAPSETILIHFLSNGNNGRNFLSLGLHFRTEANFDEFCSKKLRLFALQISEI